MSEPILVSSGDLGASGHYELRGGLGQVFPQVLVVLQKKVRLWIWESQGQGQGG